MAEEPRFQEEETVSDRNITDLLNEPRPSIDEYLISLSQDDSNTDSGSELPSLHDSSHLNQSPYQFQQEINNLKKQSNIRFKSKWEEILYKYSQIDDEKESDEIDLLTGVIITDNGHLRSLLSDDVKMGEVAVQRNIWSGTYDSEKDIQNRRKLEKSKQLAKQDLKEKLKEKQMFHITKSPNSYRNISRGQGRAPEDNLIIAKPSPTKKQRISPTKFNSFDISLNKSLAHRLSPSKSLEKDDSPSKITLNTLNIHSPNPSPTKKSPNSAIKQKFGHQMKQDLHETDASDYSEQIWGDVRKSSLSTYETKRRIMDEIHLGITDSEDVPVQSPFGSNFYRVHNNSNERPHQRHQQRPKKEEIIPYAKEAIIKVDESGRISYLRDDDISNNSWYKCAFPECSFVEKGEIHYRSHLLRSHSAALRLVGYPIPFGPIANHISESCISKLLKYFPLVYTLPDERHAGTTDQLEDYLFSCPVLGCNYSTKKGYIGMKNHFLKCKHYMPVKLRNLPSLDEMSPASVLPDVSNVKSKRKWSNDDPFSHIKEEIDEMFSEADVESDNTESESVSGSDSDQDCESADESSSEKAIQSESESSHIAEPSDDELDPVFTEHLKH